MVKHPSTGRVWFGAAPVDAVDMASSVQWLMEELQHRQAVPAPPVQIMGPNAFLVTLAAKNPAFAESMQQASLCPPDGMSVVWGARLLGTRITERVPGGEFMEQACAACAAHGFSVYFLGGLPGAAEGAALALKARYPGLLVAGTDCPPIGFEQNEGENEAVRERIRARKPDLLCVALGAPRQEIWMLDECGTLPIGAALSVGAALDTQAGLRKRAPAWTHRVGMEWLYRLAMEPRRLWKRYLIGNVGFMMIAGREWARGRKRRAMEDLLRTGPAQQGDNGARTTRPAPAQGVKAGDKNEPAGRGPLAASSRTPIH